MIISGVVMASRPEHLAQVSRAVEAIPWAEIHFSDPRGRLVVTMEAPDLDRSADRLKQLQGLPRVLTAQLAQYCIEDEIGSHETPEPPRGRLRFPSRRAIQAIIAKIRTRVRKSQPWRQS